MSECSIFLFRSIVYRSRKRYSKTEKEDYDGISDNWYTKHHPYNWRGKYKKAEPTMEDIVEKYSEDEARSILIMVKILHDTNTQIKTLIKSADTAEGMVGQSIVYRLTLYRLLDQFYDCLLYTSDAADE